MTLTELRYIVAVAKLRHFGRAAEQCFVSQPTLSVAVKKLEAELNVAIFERNKQDVRVTPIGEVIAAQAQRVLEQAEKIKQLASSGRDELKGVLRIGAIYSIGPNIFPHLLPKMHRKAPNMPLYILEGYTKVLRQKLISGDLDVILVSTPFNEPNIVTEVLFEEAFDILLPKDHALAKKSKISAKELKGENILLLGEGHCFRNQVLEVCPHCADVTPDNASTQMVEGGSLETLRYMVASGLGITILPQLACNISGAIKRSVVTRSFVKPAPKREIAIAYREGFPREKAIDLVVETLQDCNLPGVTWR